jgi:hypothetical protein
MDALQDVIARLERQREAIDRALAALHEVSSSEGHQRRRKAAVKRAGRKRRGPSPEGRRRIAEAQRARWAAKKAAEAGAAKKRPGRKNRKRAVTS